MSAGECEHAFTASGACIYCPACRDRGGVFTPNQIKEIN